MKKLARRKTHEEFVQEVNQLEGKNYTVLGEYVNSGTKILIRHNECGKEYLVAPNHFVQGKRCPSCSKINSGVKRKTHEEFVQEVFDLVGDEFTVLGKYKNGKTKIKIRHNSDKCSSNVLNITPTEFLRGNRCPVCSGKAKKTTESFSKEVQEMFNGDYTVLGEYVNVSAKILVRHNSCGKEWKVRPTNLLQGKGCPDCCRLPVTKTIDDFKNEVFNISNGEYVVLSDKYINNGVKVRFKHNSPKCNFHEYEATPVGFTSMGRRCPKCAVISPQSKGEKELFDFIKENYSGILIENDRTILDGKELDIYLPELKIGFEYNGSYWHSDSFIPRDYHLKKRDLALTKDTKLYFIDDADWVNKKDICKARILYILGSNHKSIYARKTKVYIPTSKEEKDFLTKNHIQGYIPSSLKVSLTYDDQIVAILTFVKSRKNVNQQGNGTSIELLRFSTDISCHVPGGFSKLLKYAIPMILDRFPDVTHISTFSDNNLSYGNLYEMNGFTLDHVAKPSYHYVYRGKKYNRFTFRKSELKSMFPEYYDDQLTEFQITDQVTNLHRVWNTGNNVYKLNIR